MAGAWGNRAGSMGSQVADKLTVTTLTIDTLDHDGTTLGFYGATPTTKQSATDLATLLAALDAIGLVTDASP